MASYVSNASPIQFWPINGLTYNESQFGFVRVRPYIHQWQCGDPIKLQVVDDTLGNIYKLYAIDRAGVTVSELPMSAPMFIPGGLNAYNFEFTADFCGSGTVWDWYSGDIVDWYSGVPVDLISSSFPQGGTYIKFIITANGVNAYKSDYHLFKSHIPIDAFNGSKLVYYKQPTNYAGLLYPNNGNYFTLRLPCKFFTERTQTTQTSINLTSKVIDTSEFIKFQRWLQVPVMPDYMLKKLELILGHSVKGSLLIDGLEWTKQEPVNRSGPGGDIKYPQQMADVWLTEKNDAVRNII